MCKPVHCLRDDVAWEEVIVKLISYPVMRTELGIMGMITGTSNMASRQIPIQSACRRDNEK